MVSAFHVLATGPCLEYAKKVVAALRSRAEFGLEDADFDYTDQLSVLRFADGEMEVELHKSVRGKIVFLFAACARSGPSQSVEGAKAELYHAVDVLRRSQAKKIVVFEPYISSSRSDRTTRRNSVGFWIHYKTLVSLGADHLITYQLHSDKSKTIFDPCLCAVDDISAISLLQRHLCDTAIRTRRILDEEVAGNWLFCSVDAGGEKLARRFALAFGAELVVAHKQRDYRRANAVESVSVLSAVPLEGRTAWIVDDMIDTGNSVYSLVGELAHRSLREINVMAVHPVLSDPAVDRLLELKDRGLLGRLVVCDTVPCDAARERLPFLEVIDSAPLSAEIVHTIATERQMSVLIDSFTPIEYLR